MATRGIRTATQRLAVTISATLALTTIASPAFAAQGRDNDGDAPNDSAVHEDDHTTEDDGDNAHPSGRDRSVEPGGSGQQGRSESNPDDSKGPMRYEGAHGDDKAAGPGGEDTDDQDGNNGCGNDDDFDDDNNGWCGRPTDRTKSQQAATSPASQASPAAERRSERRQNATRPAGESEPVDHEAPRDEATPAHDDDLDVEAVTVTAPEEEPQVEVPASRPRPQARIPAAVGGLDNDLASTAAPAASPADDTAVLGIVLERPAVAAAPAADDGTQVLGATLAQPAAAPGSLARTGAPWAAIGTAALALILSGTAAVHRSRTTD